MKHLDYSKTRNGYGEPGICFKDIFSMERAGDQIIFWEELDGYNSQTLSIPEAIELFKEAIGWLEGGAVDESNSLQ